MNKAYKGVKANKVIIVIDEVTLDGLCDYNKSNCNDITSKIKER